MGNVDTKSLLIRAKDALYNSFEPDNQCKLWYDIDAALRLSAAPSRAVQILRGQLYEHMEHCDNCIWERPCTRKRELDAARLAQESKTGAVTETK